VTEQQEARLRKLCENYGVGFDPEHYKPAFDLPSGWVCGWVGGFEHSGHYGNKRTLFVGVSPEGDASS
jgi:hypothetical protein